MKILLLLLTSLFAQGPGVATLDGHKITLNADTLTTDADIAFKGLRVPKGSYKLTAATQGAQWQLVVGKLGKVNLTPPKPATGPAKLSISKVAALAAKIEVNVNGTTAAATFHLDRGGADTEW